jgi:hypothetical protein
MKREKTRNDFPLEPSSSHNLLFGNKKGINPTRTGGVMWNV